VCHDNTGEYIKFPTDAGHPAYEEKIFGGRLYRPLNLTRIAQNIGKPTRRNCGVCHFYSGGGDGYKHADLNSSLIAPSRDLDVHMDAEGLNFPCQKCHTTADHRIAGRCYNIPAEREKRFHFPVKDRNRIYCESCHGNKPHSDDGFLNQHSAKVACQTCHIPFAPRGKATKVWQDWSAAGKLDENGSIIVKRDDSGNVIYHTLKGEASWEINSRPEYFWFNGSARHMHSTDKIIGNNPVQINFLEGDSTDPYARIHPIKVHRGKQPFDAVTRTFLVPKLFGPEGSGAFWSEFDWQKSIDAGMTYVGEDYSGEIAFIETAMYLPINHMVAPKGQALNCYNCHGRDRRDLDFSKFNTPTRESIFRLNVYWIAIILLILGAMVKSIRDFHLRKKGIFR
jgi:octaheme c-type cytochrome (tetrathionate reductase family)